MYIMRLRGFVTFKFSFCEFNTIVMHTVLRVFLEKKIRSHNDLVETKYTIFLVNYVHVHKQCFFFV